MANTPIDSLAAVWNNAGTTYHAIKMNVTNSASAAGSRLLTLQIGGTDKFYVDKNGAVVSAGAYLPSANDGAALGASGTAWSDLFLASGGVLNWNAGDVTITHSANLLAFAGASSGYTFDGPMVFGHTAQLAVANTNNVQITGATTPTNGLGLLSFVNGGQAHLDFYSSKSGVIGTATVVASGDPLGGINWYGAQQTGTLSNWSRAAQIRAEVDAAVTDGAGADMPGRIIFSTSPNASATILERMRIDSTGLIDLTQGTSLGILFQAGGTPLTYYRENTFTPTLAFGGGSTGLTYSRQLGSYTRVGNRVWFNLEILLSAKGSSTGVATISGLPFTIGASPALTIVAFNGTGNSLASLTSNLYFYAAVSGTTISMGQGSATGITGLNEANFGNSSILYVSGSYII